MLLVNGSPLHFRGLDDVIRLPQLSDACSLFLHSDAPTVWPHVPCICVLQGEYAHLVASNRFLLASQDATTCVMLLVWCPVTQGAWIAHLDNHLPQPAAAALLAAVEHMQQPQLFLVGGYQDDKGLGPRLALHCLHLLHQGCAAAVTLRLAVLGAANTRPDGAPFATSLVFDTSTQSLSCGLPPDRGPAVARRFAAQHCR
jgi:hypothetical protein